MKVPFVTLHSTLERGDSSIPNEELPDRFNENVAVTPINRHLPPIRRVKHRRQNINRWEDAVHGDQWTRCVAHVLPRVAPLPRFAATLGARSAVLSGLGPQKIQDRGERPAALTSALKFGLPGQSQGGDTFRRITEPAESPPERRRRASAELAPRGGKRRERQQRQRPR